MRDVSGNSRIGIERLRRKTVRDIFAWGKHLVFQFDMFALRIHFLLWGTFAADVRGTSVTGDYVRTGAPRLVLTFTNGTITVWSASVKFVEDAQAQETYDFAVDVLSDSWDPRRALRELRKHPDAEISIPGVETRVRAASQSRDLRPERVSRLRRARLADHARRASPAQLLLPEVPDGRSRYRFFRESIHHANASRTPRKISTGLIGIEPPSIR
mgnify:CR=1 FL=1